MQPLHLLYWVELNGCKLLVFLRSYSTIAENVWNGATNWKEMMKLHTQFFNTSPFFHTIITSFDLALEERMVSTQDTVNGIKTGLMGPLPLGAIFGSLVQPAGSITATSSQGQPWGIFLWIANGADMISSVGSSSEFAKINGQQRAKYSDGDRSSFCASIFHETGARLKPWSMDVTWMPHIGTTIDIQDMLNLIFHAWFNYYHRWFTDLWT